MSVLKKKKKKVKNFTFNVVPIEGDELKTLLIESPLRSRLKRKKGNTEFRIPSKHVFVNFVQLLLENNADIDVRAIGGKTLLHIAAENKEEGIMKQLLNGGANINAKDYIGKSALHVACHLKFKNIVELLLEYNADVDCRDDFKRTPIFHASEEITRILINKGANVNAADERKNTALHVTEDKNTAKLLLEYNADVNAEGNFSRTPIFEAVENLNEELIEILLNSGANINATDKNGSSVLNYVPSSDGIENVVKLLLDNNADIDIKNNKGRTPIFYHFECRNVQMVNFLLENGANINIKDENGLTPVHVAINCLSADDEVLSHFLKLKSDLNCRCNEGNTPLHIAAERVCRGTVKILLENGAEVNAINNTGHTPLHIAADGDNEYAIRALIEHGAKVNARTDDGSTPLHIAANDSNEQTIRSLLEYGADVNALNNYGRIPMENASDCAMVGLYSERIAQDVIFEHVTKLKVAGILLCDKNLEYKDLYNLCDERKLLEEIKRMKNSKINKKVSFYDILINQRIKLSDFHEDKKCILQVLQTDDYITDYPFYSNLLTFPIQNLRKEIRRKDLLNKTHQFFSSFSNYFMTIPYECADEIFSYLSCNDMKIYEQINYIESDSFLKNYTKHRIS